MTAFSSGVPHNAAFLVYINGVEVPATRVTRRYGVWQVPEVQISMVPDPVLTRLGAEDRVQVEVFYLDDTSVDPSVTPQFRLWFDGEITGWGYQSTSSGRVITFTAVNQIAVFTQLFVQFLTTFDDLLGHATLPGVDATGIGVPSSEIVFPFSLFKQGLLPSAIRDEATGNQQEGLIQDASSIVRPFDFLYNVVRNMIGAQVPPEQRTVPAANFFARWARLTNFHNRFAASPFFDEIVDNPNIFPVLKALQNVSAIDTIARNLIPNVQNAGSIWDMLQLVFQTMLFEIAMIPSMPLVTVQLSSGLVQPTNFSEHVLTFDRARAPNGAWVPRLAADSRKTNPKRIPSYFPKPQVLFGIPPSCNVIFPSQLKALAYDETYATQPTRLYFNDETITRLLKIPRSGFGATVQNSLTIAYPPEADAMEQARRSGGGARFNGKNFLLWPEEFFKGPVLDRRDVPPWLFFLKQNELFNAPSSGKTVDGAVETPPPPSQTSQARPPAPSTVPADVMKTAGRVGVVAPDGKRTFDRAVEQLRPKVEKLALSSGIPADFLLAWISHESGGSLRTVTKLNERGYFQIMGPHVSNGKAVQLRDTEAAAIGLTITDTGTGPEDTVARLSTDPDFSLQAGIKLVQYYRRIADRVRADVGLAWSEADMWRLTKLQHTGLGSAKQIMALAVSTLGRAPVSWEEMYQAVKTGLTGNQPKLVDNATAVGGVVAGASGVMTTASDPNPVKAPPAAPAPRGPADVASPPSVAAAPAPEVDPTIVAGFPQAESVYQLYAKYEYFRERYARRSGSAQLAWNPYVVAGFPAMIFDHRSSRVDIVCYVTTVIDEMDANGRRQTSISFLYGRQLQEMFDLLAKQFSLGEASAGAAPAEPIRDVRKIIQSFARAEEYYRRVFYGGLTLYNKDASFDFRKIVGYAPEVAGDPPVEIFVDGPEEADQDDFAAAQAQLATLTQQRGDLSSQISALQAQLATNRQIIAEVFEIDPSDIEHIVEREEIESVLPTVDQQRVKASQAIVDNLTIQIPQLQTRLAALDEQIRTRLAIVQSTQAAAGVVEVTHNLVGDREIVPLPAARPLFDSYEAAMRYAWRPICTLDEYIVFHNAGGEGLVPAFSGPASLGAHYYERIRRLRPNTNDVLQPPGADGLAVAPVAPDPQTAAQQGPVDPWSGQPAQAASATSAAPGLSYSEFPQTRADWDKALIAYRTNVRTVKAPRT